MIKLNDYLYSGDTVLKILENYSNDLKKAAMNNENPIDMVHGNYLMQISEILKHNDFLTSQSQRLREFYKYMVKYYPDLAFNFKGRIKSIIRAEEKFNGNVVQYAYDYYLKNKEFPDVESVKSRLSSSKFRDIIAYRIVISLPKRNLKMGQDLTEEEIKILYDIANHMPSFLEQRGFTVVPETGAKPVSELLSDEVKGYYRDYIKNPNEYGYQSLHVAFYDDQAECYIEVQLRTKEMDDYAEIGPANHLGYEKRQAIERTRNELIPFGECQWFDESYERVQLLQQLELKDLDVNMFKAVDNSLINDGCGLFRGRLILPYEHISRFQNGIID